MLVLASRPEDSPALWQEESTNSFFVLQHTRLDINHTGIFKSVLGTLRNMMDTRPDPYRILYVDPTSGEQLIVAVGETFPMIEKTWDWLRGSVLEVALASKI
ncbi:TBC1 domain member 8B [Entomophthora muscae]|uniref:TBC1 domain member 8B n=1 Tax=Entomophthora muscae TaxID=34485 RepID=A0ACC2RNH6_9FUNG|nr:TBC1 domain member 8B [Entomophthora muscae]